MHLIVIKSSILVKRHYEQLSSNLYGKWKIISNSKRRSSFILASLAVGEHFFCFFLKNCCLTQLMTENCYSKNVKTSLLSTISWKQNILFFHPLSKDRITLNGYKRSWPLFIIPMNSSEFELQDNDGLSVKSFCSIYVSVSWFSSSCLKTKMAEITL